MNTTITSCSSEHSWTTRRFSIESVLSIQGKDTDVVCDTSDTESPSDRDVEYEPVTESEDEGPVTADSSGESDADLIRTRVLRVLVASSDGADSEPGSDACDSELDLHDYWRCAQCRAANNNPLYRYCERCFKVRKNFFPPRPKRKAKLSPREPAPAPGPVHALDSVDSGIDSAFNSQDLSQSQALGPARSPPHAGPKRRAESVDRTPKRAKLGSDDDADERPRLSKSEDRKPADVAPLVKTSSDPALTVEGAAGADGKSDLCIVCFTEPKSGVFVHGRIAHICCCYKCSVKVWARSKRCPVCNCKVSNVLRAVVM